MDIIDKFIIIDHFVNDSDDAYIISLELNVIPLNVRGGEGGHGDSSRASICIKIHK